jgi:hypothetical protein
MYLGPTVATTLHRASNGFRNIVELEVKDDRPPGLRDPACFDVRFQADLESTHVFFE